MPRDDNTFKQTIGRPGSTCFRLLVSLIYVFYRHPSLFLLLMISLSAATFTALYQEQNTLQELYGIIENPRQKLAHLTRRDELFVARVRHIELHNRGIACSLPKIDPFHESVAKHMKDYGPLHCPGAMYSGLDSRKHSLSVRGRNLSRVSVQSITRPYQDDFGFKLERTEFLFKAEKTTIRRIEKGMYCLQTFIKVALRGEHVDNLGRDLTSSAANAHPISGLKEFHTASRICDILVIITLIWWERGGKWLGLTRIVAGVWQLLTNQNWARYALCN